MLGPAGDHVAGRPRQVQSCRGKSGLHGTRCRVMPGGSGKPGSGTVPQRRDRRWLRKRRTGKGETVRQERTARWATKAARQTPPGARPNRDGARISVRRAGTGPVIRVGCWRRRATAVREEWSPRGLTPLDRTRLIGGVRRSLAAHNAQALWADSGKTGRAGCRPSGRQNSFDGVAPPRSCFSFFLLPSTLSGLGGSAAGRRKGRKASRQSRAVRRVKNAGNGPAFSLAGRSCPSPGATLRVAHWPGCDLPPPQQRHPRIPIKQIQRQPRRLPARPFQPAIPIQQQPRIGPRHGHELLHPARIGKAECLLA
jgi:hypothetical protein